MTGRSHFTQGHVRRLPAVPGPTLPYRRGQQHVLPLAAWRPVAGNAERGRLCARGLPEADDGQDLRLESAEVNTCLTDYSPNASSTSSGVRNVPPRSHLPSARAVACTLSLANHERAR